MSRRPPGDPIRVRLPQPSLREVYRRLGFEWERNGGTWHPIVWAVGWRSEREVLSDEERADLARPHHRLRLIDRKTRSGSSLRQGR